MASLSATLHTGKTIVYLIQIIHTDFDSPCNVMAKILALYIFSLVSVLSTL